MAAADDLVSTAPRLPDGSFAPEVWHGIVGAAYAKALSGEEITEVDLIALLVAFQNGVKAGHHLFLFRSNNEIIRAVLTQDTDPDAPLSDEEHAWRSVVAGEAVSCALLFDALREALRRYHAAGHDLGYLATSLVVALCATREDVLSTISAPQDKETRS